MTIKKEAPKIGDMYRCAKCNLEIHVTNGCDCQDCKAEFNCCGKSMDRVTSLPVQNA
ncbi:hypothetical protein Pla52o_17200 [Novipirellula galeiformis]|uniref:Desulfoferrodoxin N-terminal domain-containing protein n=1 Tax=Novipirellula galeiformis TaxID=2528004 RepID=A0A5C6CRE6_9BACT|nr:hypothetical protein Pla52o_17200 [Novipirellula galeiformis]